MREGGSKTGLILKLASKVNLVWITALLAFVTVNTVINPRHACAVRVTVVGSVCLSVTQHLTSRTFVCLTIGTTYSTGSEGQTFCVVFSENAPLQS